MKIFMSTIMAAALCSPAFAAPLKLEPADPQPTEVTAGLAVSYGFNAGGRTLDEARSILTRARPGTPLSGLSYFDGDGNALTSNESTKVAAAISGYIRFEAAGTYEVNFFSNDGLDANIGGQQVALADEVRGCDPTGVTEVSVPVAGWYALEATYFQRKGTSCLMMDWTVGGEMAPVPDSAFGFTE